MNNATALLKEIKRLKDFAEMHMKSKGSTNAPSSLVLNLMVQRVLSTSIINSNIHKYTLHFQMFKQHSVKKAKAL